jgi:TolA-binding protein
MYCASSRCEGIEMKKYGLIIPGILLVQLSLSVPAWADEAASRMSGQEAGDNNLIVKSEKNSVFKGLLYKVWERLRSLNPRVKTNKSHQTVATMGIRGAETTSSLIEPYWKGDKTSDPGYIKELRQYTQAQQFAEQGDLPKAVSALNTFLDQHSSSDLRPNAQFALGISQGGMGDVADSKKTLQAFLKDYPKHPLAKDAREVIDQL